MVHLLLVLGTFIVSVLVIALVLVFTRRYGLYDRIDERKVHTGNIPRLGGVGIFVAFVAGIIVFSVLSTDNIIPGNRVLPLVVSCFLIFVMGVWDDMKPWRARYKLLVQCVSALLVIYAGFRCQDYFTLPGGFVLNIGWLALPVTFFWLIGVTNALNLIDGIDGLAGSVSVLALLVFAGVFYLFSNVVAMFFCLILAAAVAGFLVYNLPFPKAKIFMGDGGSQFLGFALAVLPLFPDNLGKAEISLPYAVAVLIIPIFDTIAAVWRRLREKRRFDSPDKFHLHHKLMMMGFSAPHALVLLVFLQVIISLLVLVSLYIRGSLSYVLLSSVYCIGILFFTLVHIRKEELLEKSLKL